MRLSKIICSFIVLLFCYTNAIAQSPLAGSGCLIGTRMYINYRQTITTGSPVTGYRYRYYDRNSNDYYELTCPTGATSSQSRYVLGGAAIQNAPAGFPTTVGCGTGSTYASLASNTMYFYTAIACPFDYYMPFLLLGITFISIFYIRKNTILI